jgi:hypothetical protein
MRPWPRRIRDRWSDRKIGSDEEKCMDCLRQLAGIASTFACVLAALSAGAADYPTPREASWVARGFRVHTGEVMPQFQLHYRTIGAPKGEPVLVDPDRSAL